MIKVTNLSKSFKNKVILENINLSISEDEIVSICGKNGCGKTTFLSILSGLLQYDSGKIDFNESLNSFSQISYVTSNDNSFFSRLTMFENLKHFGAFYYGDHVKLEKDLMSLISKLDLDEKINHSYSVLSAGEKKKMSIVRALMKSPQVLLLDEYSSNIDLISRETVKNIIKKRKLTVIQTTHNAEDITKFSDRIMIMGNKSFNADISLTGKESLKEIKKVITNL